MAMLAASYQATPIHGACINTSLRLHDSCTQIHADGYSYLFDMIEADEAARKDIVTGLAGLLQADHIEVVMHDGRQDAAALMYQCGGIFIANIFDTQVCHAGFGSRAFVIDRDQPQ